MALIQTVYQGIKQCMLSLNLIKTHYLYVCSNAGAICKVRIKVV